MSKKKNWGGARKSAGRPRGEKKVQLNLLLTLSSAEKLRSLGGSKWVEKKMEALPESLPERKSVEFSS